MPTDEHEVVETRDGMDTGGDSAADDEKFAHIARSFDAASATSAPSTEVDTDTQSSVSESPVTAADVSPQIDPSWDPERDDPLADDTVDNAAKEDLDAQSKQDAVGEGEDSIEAYMNQLLARVRSGEDSTTAPVEPTRSAVKSSQMPTRQADDDQEDKNDDEPSEFVPQSQAPEQRSTFSAMRELANDSVKSAIETHDAKSGVGMTVAKLIFAGAGVAAATLSMLYFEDDSMMKLLGVGVGLGAATVWTWQAFRSKRHSPVVVKATKPDKNDDANSEA